MSINLSHAKELIAQGQLEEALEVMKPHFPEDAALLLNRLRTAKRDRNLNTITFDEWTRTQAQIGRAALDLLDSKPAQKPPVVPPVVPLEPSEPNSPANPPPPKEAPAAVSPHIPWIMGLLLLLGSALALLTMAPCPTPGQETVFRLLMALGAAGVATVLPGLFHIEMANIKAGSAIGVFALVYLVNPASTIKDDSRCQKQPFEFTIALMPDKQLRLSPQYPKLKDATLKIRLSNKWEPAPVNAEGDADYKSIPGDFKDSTVAVQLAARYWKLQRDSVALKGKSTVINIVPDGSLGRVTGRVWENNGTTPIADALVEVDDMSARTDARGYFALDVPVEKQQAVYRIRISKSLYENISESAPFEGEILAFRLKRLVKRK